MAIQRSSLYWLLFGIFISRFGVKTEFHKFSENFYKIPLDQQKSAINKVRTECFLKMLNKNYTSLESTVASIEGWCPLTFDKILCWEETPPSTVVRINCPNYVDTFRINGSATKTCTSNGTWFTKGGQTWTNYSECKTHDMTTWQQFRNIHIIGLVGHGISMFTLVIAIAILCLFRRLRCDRNYIHLNLFVAFLMRALVYFPTLLEPKQKILCRLLRVANNYLIQTSYQSIFTEALYMHNIIFYHTLDSSRTNAMFYIIPCWMLPAIVTGIWALLRYLYNNVFCWDLSMDEYRRDFWLLNSYVILLTLGNCLLFMRLTCSLCSKVNSHLSQEREKYRKLARSICVLVIVFGVYNVIFIPLEFLNSIRAVSNLEIIKLYMQHLVNSIQGFLVSLLLCFINGEVHRELSVFIRTKFSMLSYDPNNNHSVICGGDAKKLRGNRRSQLYDYVPTSTNNKAQLAHNPRRHSSNTHQQKHHDNINKQSCDITIDRCLDESDCELNQTT